MEISPSTYAENARAFSWGPVAYKCMVNRQTDFSEAKPLLSVSSASFVMLRPPSIMLNPSLKLRSPCGTFKQCTCVYMGHQFISLVKTKITNNL